MNGKIWSFIFVLFLTIANLGVGSSSSETAGTAIVAVRTSSVIGLGHVGVAFQNADGTWTAGAIEGGRALMELGKYDDAIQALDEALRLDPNYLEALLNRGLALKALGRLNE